MLNNSRVKAEKLNWYVYEALFRNNGCADKATETWDFGTHYPRSDSNSFKLCLLCGRKNLGTAKLLQLRRFRRIILYLCSHKLYVDYILFRNSIVVYDLLSFKYHSVVYHCPPDPSVHFPNRSTCPNGPLFLIGSLTQTTHIPDRSTCTNDFVCQIALTV